MSFHYPRFGMPPLTGLMHRLFRRARPGASREQGGALSPATVPPGIRIYAVGDVHGRADLLARLFERIDADRDSAGECDSIEILLGDYIDRGPESREVIDMLIAREKVARLVCLTGNHEDMLLRALGMASRMAEWMNNGGRETLLSYGIVPLSSKSEFELHAELNDRLPESHRAFLHGLRLSYECGDYFFVHAGIDPDRPFDRQRAEDLLWIRDRFLAHTGPLEKIVVHGHTPQIRPQIRGYKINLDTGAYITGTLTCLVLEGERRRLL
jgi:serine/threonine protein phosphatase 1